MTVDLLAIIKSQYSDMSKGHKAIADYILNHYDKAAFMTAASLGNAVGVSESTVVRFPLALGLEGYPELQRALQNLIRNKLTSLQRIEVAEEQMGKGDILEKVLSADIEKIQITLAEIDKNAFEGASESIANAKNIYILGVRSSAALANFLSFYLTLIKANVRLVTTTSASEIFEQMLRVGEGDVVIGISFPRYSKRTTKALAFAKDRGATVVAVTDNENSPLALSAEYLLAARSDMISFADSLVAPLSLINALIVSVGLKRKTKVEDAFAELERIWDEYEVYEKTVNDGNGL